MRWKPSSRLISVDARMRPVVCRDSLKEERSTDHPTAPIWNHSEMLSRYTLRAFRATLSEFSKFLPRALLAF
jgi:hypothetical protein